MAPRKTTASTYNFPNPMDNEHLVGHSDVMSAFMEAWSARDVHPIHPVWMLTGPRGIGKATLAYKIARMVYGNVGDFFIIDMAHNIDDKSRPKPEGKVITVHTVRAMIERMQMSSMSGQWRVILIDSVDELNTEASNAILKLLEEPPAKTLFLLVVHQLSNVLPTVRSRARVEKLRPLTIAQLRELCAKFIPDGVISTDTLRLANGSFGKIAALKQSGGDVVYEKLMELLRDKHTSAGGIISLAKKIGADPALHGILLDAAAELGLAELYPAITRQLNDIKRLNLEAESAIFKIVSEIKECL